MKRLLINKIGFLIVSLLFLILGLFGISRLHLRSGVPFQWEKEGNQVIIVAFPGNKIVQEQVLVRGDRLLNIENYPIQNGCEIDFILDHSIPGNKVSFIIQRGDQVLTIALTLVPRFSNRYIIINLLLGLLFWLVGIFVYLNKPRETAARVFFWGSMTLSASIMCNWPGYPSDIGFWGYVQMVLYFIIYPLAPALILYFTTIYPKEKRIVLNYKLWKESVSKFYILLTFRMRY